MNTPFDMFAAECGPGWKKLYEPLLELAKAEGVQVTQIKEKFGGLRFYIFGGSEKLYAAIERAEAESLVTCEECGAAGTERGGGWVRTLCDEHAG